MNLKLNDESLIESKTFDINDILKAKIPKRVKIQKESIFLYRYFVRKFKSMPKLVFSNKRGILIFLTKNKMNTIFRKYSNRIEAFRKNFTHPIYFINYSGTVKQIILNLFHPVKIQYFICDFVNDEDNKYLALCDSPEFLIEKNIPINILTYIEDNQMGMALGQKGDYVHLVNDFLEKNVGKLTILLRSLFI